MANPSRHILRSAHGFAARALRALACVSLAALLAIGYSLPTAYVGKAFVGKAYAAKPKTAYELQEAVNATQAVYNEARAAANAAAEEVTAHEMRIGEITAAIPAQQERSATATRELYKFQSTSSSLLTLLFASDSFDDFFKQIEYMSRVSEANRAEIERLNTLVTELKQKEAELKAVKSAADAKVEAARAAMEEAQAAQAEMQRRAAEDARIAAEAEALAKELAEHPRDNTDNGVSAGSKPTGDVSSLIGGGEGGGPASSAAGGAGSGAGAGAGAGSGAGTSSGASGAGAGGSAGAGAGSGAGSAGSAGGAGGGGSSVGGGSSTGGATGAGSSGGSNLSPEEQFVAEWAPRIDAYLKGYPLAGQGETFARAAYRYNVDPRFSPAIACTESGKGRFCFKPYNAWGWGSVSWSSWPEAINAHVNGLSRLYGYTVSVEGAKKYCPPNWEHWYNMVSSQMELI